MLDLTKAHTAYLMDDAGKRLEWSVWERTGINTWIRRQRNTTHDYDSGSMMKWLEQEKRIHGFHIVVD